MLQPKKLMKLTIKPAMIGCVFRTEPFRIALDGTALQQAEIELTEQDKARSAALILNLKNRENT